MEGERPTRRPGPGRFATAAPPPREVGRGCTRIGRLTCRECGDSFLFSAGEQAFFASKGLQNDPQRCASCRAVAKQNRTAGAAREYHAAVCARCGQQAMVPFAPRNDRPVYCSSCFDVVRVATTSASAPA